MKILDSSKMFFRYWACLMPILLLSLSTLGRGVGNSLWFLLFVWGVVSLRVSSFRRHIKPLVVWGLMIASILMSILYNYAWDYGYKQWMVFTMASMVLLFVINWYERWGIRSPEIWVAGAVVLPFFVYITMLIYYYFSPYFDPVHQLSGTTLASLFPFIIITFYLIDSQNWYKFVAVVMVLTILLLILGDSRTEPVMVLVSMVVFVSFYLRKLLFFSLIPVIMVGIIIIFSAVSDRNKVEADEGAIKFLNQVTSNRYQRWTDAIEFSPENPWLGIGVNNKLAYSPEIREHSALHNAFLELWYETGYIGIGLVLLLFFLLLKNLFKIYSVTTGRHRLIYATYLASFSAVFTAVMLDKGYMSIYFKFFIFYLGAMLYILGEKESFEQFENNKIENEN